MLLNQQLACFLHCQLCCVCNLQSSLGSCLRVCFQHSLYFFLAKSNHESVSEISFECCAETTVVSNPMKLGQGFRHLLPSVLNSFVEQVILRNFGRFGLKRYLSTCTIFSNVFSHGFAGATKLHRRMYISDFNNAVSTVCFLSSSAILLA